MAEIEVVNVVGTITYQQELDLGALAETFALRDEIFSVTYEPTDNHWLQTRFEPDNTYVAFYRSGRCSVVGCKSIEHFHDVSDCVNSVMHDLLDFDYEPKTKVSNIVATVELNTAIPLELLAVELGLDIVEYEPEQFPALVYRNENHVILVFASGKLLFTGLTNIDEVSDAVDQMAARVQSIS